MITRRSTQVDTTITSGQSVSEIVGYENWAGGILRTPATLDATTVIGFKVSQDGTNFYTLYDKDNALVKLTVTLNESRAYPLPDEMFGTRYFKIFTCTTGGVAVNQTGDKAFKVSLKG